MRIEQTGLPGLSVITPKIIEDERGFFIEMYRQDVLKTAGIDIEFVQANHSSSQKGVVRGLHFQWDKPLGKFIRVIRGKAFAVAADIRKSSPTFKKWFSLELSAENKRIFWVPFGFAFGFTALQDNTELEYQYTALYNPKGESNVLWNDPELAIAWPVAEPIVSQRDRGAQSLKEWLVRPESDLF